MYVNIRNTTVKKKFFFCHSYFHSDNWQILVMKINFKTIITKLLSCSKRIIKIYTRIRCRNEEGDGKENNFQIILSDIQPLCELHL